MKSKLFTSLALLFLSISLMAQTKVTIHGTVSDELGPLYGASVIEKGTIDNGVITDLDGKWSIMVAKGSTIVVSSVGFKDVEILVDERIEYNVILQEDKLMLEEAVAVGYGSMKKSDLSGASVSVKESQLKASIVSSLDQTLQGRVAGVQAVQTSGAPGSSSTIRVRGQATINANAEPLYVIDGVIVQGGVIGELISASEMLSETVRYPPSLLSQPSTLQISSAWKSSRMPPPPPFTVHRVQTV